jgi:thiamine-monophosphate kinase
VSSEFARIEQLCRIFDAHLAAVPVGIGDDAAVLDMLSLGQNASRVVWTIDSSVEGVHFRRDIASYFDVGWRSFMAAASDLAAMGARPIGAIAAVMLTSDMTDEDLYEIARGQRAAADSIGTAIIGGNLSKAGEYSVSTTVLGHASRTVCRNGARVGDVFAVCGELGFAGAGLRCLLDGLSAGELAKRAIKCWQRPVALIDSGLVASAHATSMIDVSDGLALDASHIAEASGLRIELNDAALANAELEVLAKQIGTSALALMLSGGEDYALLATFEPSQVPLGFRVIGKCVQGAGVYIRERRVDALGHDHFASA